VHSVSKRFAEYAVMDTHCLHLTDQITIENLILETPLNKTIE